MLTHSLRAPLLALLLLAAAPRFAQAQTGSVGIGTTTPNASAALDVSSTSKGFLPPRLSTAQRNAMSPAPTAAAAGLTIYNTDTQSLNTWDGTRWLLTPTYTTTPPPASLPDVTFAYTGSTQTYTVPASVRQLTVVARGAAGYGSGGRGAVVQATLVVVPGEVLVVEVGGTPYNGGGAGNTPNMPAVYAGGGATDLRRLLATGVTGDYSSSRNALLVAGGGGSQGNSGITTFGGSGGTPLGGAGNGSGGSGATQQGPGSVNGGNAGTNNQGGAATSNGSVVGGGGGGGYYGGGGGSTTTGGGGGGGSSWVVPGVGATNVSYAVATAGGVGSLTISPIPSLATVTYNPSPTGGGSSGSGSPAGNLTGDVTSAGLATTYANVVPAAKGGAGTVSGLLKADGTGLVSAAAPGTDYLTPAGAATSLIQNQATSAQAGGFNVAGTGTVGGLLTAGSATVGGRVGIGTSSPTQALDVRGNVRLGDDGSGVGTGPAIEFVGPGFSTDPVGVYRVNPAADQSELRVVVGDVADPNDKFVLGRMAGTNAEGGIPAGTFTPTFSVSSTGQVTAPGLAGTGPRVVTADATGTLSATQALPTDAQQLSLRGNTLTLTNGGSVVLPSGGTGGTGGGDNLGDHTATQNLDLATNQLVGNGGTAGLAVSSTGNVGIGTTSPAARLDVVGTVRIPAASGYTYDGPRAYTLMLGAFDFRPEDGVTPLLYRQGTEEVYPGTASSSIFRAPVHLPQGALVTSITLLSYDNEPSYDIQAQLMEYRTVSFQSYNMSMGRAVTSGTPWYSEVSSDVYGYPVDNNTRAVSVRVIFGVGNTPSLTLRGVRVNYTVSRVD